jgi:glycosyltransferase involved in cell wall biosynthesis
MSIPLLILGDAPTAATGLGRITRDLATRIHAHLPEFRVGTLGCYGSGSRALEFPQYDMGELYKYIPVCLPDVWKDFAGNEQGIILTIWDASRLLWFTRPEHCPVKHVREFLEKRRFLKWGYLPIDATGPNDALTGLLRVTIEAFDRVLAYSEWASNIVNRSLHLRQRHFTKCEWLPHGINADVFCPRDRIEARKNFPIRVKRDDLLIGIVATNQARKDFGLGIQVVSELAKERSVRLWINTDTLNRAWCIEDLLADYGLLDKALVTLGGLTDEQMSWYYSACDVTLGIGSGEGFGYPIFESMACNTACVHGNYGGAAEHIPSEFLVTPCAYRVEGIYGAVRPVFRAEDWVKPILTAAKWCGPMGLPEQLDWNNLWPNWASWLKSGVECSERKIA